MQIVLTVCNITEGGARNQAVWLEASLPKAVESLEREQYLVEAVIRGYIIGGFSSFLARWRDLAIVLGCRTALPCSFLHQMASNDVTAGSRDDLQNCTGKKCSRSLMFVLVFTHPQNHTD